MKNLAHVEHNWYGCESGCCGHSVIAKGIEEWFFSHPYDEDKAVFAQNLVTLAAKATEKDLQWDGEIQDISND